MSSSIVSASTLRPLMASSIRFSATIASKPALRVCVWLSARALRPPFPCRELRPVQRGACV